jgi:hypothetical protein
VDELERPSVHRGEKRIDKALRLLGRQRGVEVGNDFAEHKVGRKLQPPGPLETLVHGLGSTMVLVPLCGQRDPRPGINEDHARGFP